MQFLSSSWLALGHYNRAGNDADGPGGHHDNGADGSVPSDLVDVKFAKHRLYLSACIATETKVVFFGVSDGTPNGGPRRDQCAAPKLSRLTAESTESANNVDAAAKVRPVLAVSPTDRQYIVAVPGPWRPDHFRSLVQ